MSLLENLMKIVNPLLERMYNHRYPLNLTYIFREFSFSQSYKLKNKLYQNPQTFAVKKKRNLGIFG
jgi:hypothetical protein